MMQAGFIWSYRIMYSYLTVKTHMLDSLSVHGPATLANTIQHNYASTKYVRSYIRMYAIAMAKLAI